MSGEQSVFITDMQIIRDYVTLRDETLHPLITQFNGGLNNFETTIRSSSPAEAQPHILKLVAKSAVKLIEKAVTNSIKEAAHVNIGPVIELVHAINDEMERAGTALTNLQVDNWIVGLRSSVNNVLLAVVRYRESMVTVKQLTAHA